jgi:crotonobetainyl-CoA hydratase
MSASRADEPVVVSLDGHVMVVVFNRPEIRNAIDTEMTDVIRGALQRADADDSVRVVVVTGAGDKAFCAGADIRVLAGGRRTTGDGADDWGFASIVRHRTAKPLIAAVNGATRGGGVEIVLACDLAVCADTATFGMPEVQRGRLAGAGGAFRLPAQLGRKRGLQMLLTGQPIDAATALEWGLVNRVVPRASVLESAMELAARIAANAPLSVQATKRIACGGSVDGPAGERLGWEATRREVEAIRASRDAREGVEAFLEHRVPVWRNR